MNENQSAPGAGAVCDALDEILACLAPAQTIAVSHLYVARHLLVAHLENRPSQTSATAFAELSAAEIALQQAHNELPQTERTKLDSELAEVTSQVGALRAAIASTEMDQIGWCLSGSSMNYEADEWVPVERDHVPDFERDE